MIDKREELVQGIIESLARYQRLAQPLAWNVLGLSRAQLGLLFMLFHHHDMHVKKIAQYLGVSKSAASQLLDPLVDKKLVNRQADSQDRRIYRLVITPAGVRLVKKIEKLKYAGLRSALSELSAKDLELMAGLHSKIDIKLAINK